MTSAPHRARRRRPRPRALVRGGRTPGDTLTIIDLGGNQAVDFLVYDAARHRRPLQRPRHHPGPGQHLPHHRQRAAVERAQPADDGRRRRPAAGTTPSAAPARKESNTLRYGHHTWSQHACVENFLAEGGRHGLGKRDLVSNINWYMNVPVEPDGDARHRRRHLRAGPDGLPARRERRARAGLQLPADQQPVQRLRPDAGADDGDRRMTADSTRCSSPTAARSPSASSAPRATLGLRTVAVYSDADAGRRARPTSPTRPCGSARAAAQAATSRRPGPGGRARTPARARSTPATASCPRTRRSPARSRPPGIAFVGPTPEQLELFGAKHTARAAAEAAGVPLLRRHRAAGRRSTRPLAAAAARSATRSCSRRPAGGGGIGMRACRDADELAEAWERGAPGRRRRFGSAGVFLERLVEARAPRRGAGVRRRRGRRRDLRRPRLLPAAPQPEGRGGGARARPPGRRPRARSPTPRATLCASVGYRSAGTVEFVYDAVREEAVVPRGQHPPPGRAPGHRGDLRRRPRRVDAAARPGRHVAVDPRRREPARRTPSRPGSTPRTPTATTGPAPGMITACRVPDGVRVDTWVETGHRGHHRTTTRCSPR